MDKTGQMDTVMSWFVFGSYVLILFFVASVACSCSSSLGCDKSKKSIETDFGKVADLRTSQQLSGYLRTKLPEPVIQDLRVGFLDDHPEIYSDSTYGEFISKMCLHQNQDAFHKVTDALFNSPDGYDPFVEVFCEDYDPRQRQRPSLKSPSRQAPHNVNTGLKILPKTGPESGVITVKLKIDQDQEQQVLTGIEI